MSWQLLVPPQVETELRTAASDYESLVPGLGARFKTEIIHVLRSIQSNPFLNSRRHPSLNIRWRNARRFPYRVVYEISDIEKKIIVAAVFHTARDESRWTKPRKNQG